MCMDIMHFQPSVTLEFLLEQTLICIRMWHSDVMKRYAYQSDSPESPKYDRSMYEDGVYKQGDGTQRRTISFSSLAGMTPQEGAILERQINRGFQ